VAKAQAKSNLPVKAAKKAVATPVATGGVQVPEYLEQGVIDHAGEGLERATMRDFALPFLYLLQKGNPQVDENDDKYLEGAKPGMFLNTVTNELFDELQVVPVDFEKVFNEWVPRDAGGGFVASWPSQEQAEAGKREDTQIVETSNHYVLYRRDDGTWGHAVLSLTSTKLKSSRNWLSQIAQRMVNTGEGRKVAPSYSCVYVVSSVSDSNEHGTFFTTAIAASQENDGFVPDVSVFNQALDFRKQLKAGILRVDMTKAKDPGSEGADGAEGEDDKRY
jgi:hypothetical protein